MHPPDGDLGWVGVTRNVNLRALNGGEEPENRPFRYGLSHLVRLLRKDWWENRSHGFPWLLVGSDPPPVGEAGGLPAALSLFIPEGPDAGIVDYKPASFAVDTNTPIALKGIHFLGAA